MNWTELPAFKGIDLSESYILGWAISESTLEFQLEVVLCPEHPQFQQPPSSEWACYHPGHLIFEDLESLTGLPLQSEVFPTTDATGAIDFGHIDSLTVNGNHFEVAGDFGLASFKASGVKVDLVAV